MQDAMNRVQPRHKGYVMKRAEGLSPAQAWEEAMPRVNSPAASAKRLEERPVIRTAIAATEAVVLRGSLMTAAQRRDHVLDRLLVESLESGDSGRVTSLIHLGKTCGLFLDKAEHSTASGQGVRQRIDALLKSIMERDVVASTERVNSAAADTVEDAQVIDSTGVSGIP